MEFKLLTSQDIEASEQQFWKAIEIWLNNPHLINRRISTSTTIVKAEVNDSAKCLIETILSSDLSHLLENYTNNRVVSTNSDPSNPLVNQINPFENDKGVYIFIRKLFPRNENDFAQTTEFFVLDKNTKSIVSISKNFGNEKQSLGLLWPYRIVYNHKQVNISIQNLNETSSHSGIQWLKEKFFPRLIKWIEFDDEKNSLVKGSLNLISSEKYTQLYISLKKKYGIDLVKKWPECTDPAKFVYEDIAIATYLILLWEQERNEEGLLEKQSFLDLGCGNGLLVFILSNEGHPGLGIDLRKRKIWDLFSGTCLEERTIIPSSKSLFPNTDWIIGNHSDELTPWIPVIASRSSYKCKFFLLPCCAHEFDGRKFQRNTASNSQYFDYLEYIRNVCEGCGFLTKLDKLRIPSTKRICFIGGKRKYSENEKDDHDIHIEEIIKARSVKYSIKEEAEKFEDKWSQNFKPREVTERVRNCTQIDKNIINEIVALVATELLRKVHMIAVNEENPLKKWNAGGSLKLIEIVKLVPSETLKELKKECGGLQTLIKNNSHIFQVDSGLVRFNIPGSKSRKKNRRGNPNIQLRVKPCWFFNNHPEGCPINQEKCNFKHDRN